MNKKRNILLGVGFLSLAIFAIIVTAMMYVIREQNSSDSEKNVAVYVATKNIVTGQKITPDDIALRSLPYDYVGAEPLSMADIVDHYARVDIMKNDYLRFEKLSLKMPSMSEPIADAQKILENNSSKEGATHDVISIPLNVFKNPDTSLRVGDHIDIVGISEYGEEKHQFATHYIALNLSVSGFMKDGKKVETIVSVTIDEKTQASTKVLADEILLEMSPKEIGRFLSLYYRSQELNNDRSHNSNNLYQGHIWMIQCNSAGSAAEEALKQKMMAGPTLPRHTKHNTVRPLPALPKLIASPKGIVSYEH
ncbi:SAF domain-containing protein [Sulfuricurvum sp.]|uniref:SAF domain-containing protein n=1 Tax=Sulfuricurvum sp. TaxID=2025608 RepID=UPI003C55EA18